MENDIAEMIRQGLAADGAERRKREAEEEARREAEKITLRLSPKEAETLHNTLAFVRLNPRHSPSREMKWVMRNLEQMIEAETGFDIHEVAKRVRR